MEVSEQAAALSCCHRGTINLSTSLLPLGDAAAGTRLSSHSLKATRQLHFIKAAWRSRLAAHRRSPSQRELASVACYVPVLSPHLRISINA